MIEITLWDGDRSVFLLPVDHVSTAADAAKALFNNVNEVAKSYGGRASLDDVGYGFKVTWEGGPPSWPTEYVKGEGADTPGFVAEAEDLAVVFTELL